MVQEVARPGSVPAPGSGRRARWTAALALASLAFAAHAQSPAPPSPAAKAVRPAAADLPSARSVIDRHVRAIGGREAVLAHSSTHARGTLSMPMAGMTGELDVYAAKPNKSLVKITLGGVGSVVEGFDGTHGWTLSPMTGPMLLEGRQLEDKRFDAEYHAELKNDARYASMTTVEKTEFDGRPCYKLRLLRRSGVEDIEFYDVATGLKAGGITTRETQMGTVTATTVERDYRKFGNLLQATTIRSQFSGMEQVITLASVEYDSVPASVFEMPAEIKALSR
jgi:hypothetical protein